MHSCQLDGTDLITVVPAGLLDTPKQLMLDPVNRNVYLCRREGLRILRCALDGWHVETLIEIGDPDVNEQKLGEMRWCVGLAMDWKESKIYWTQKGTSFSTQVYRLALTPSGGCDLAVD